MRWDFSRLFWWTARCWEGASGPFEPHPLNGFVEGFVDESLRLDLLDYYNNGSDEESLEDLRNELEYNYIQKLLEGREGSGENTYKPDFKIYKELASRRRHNTYSAEEVFYGFRGIIYLESNNASCHLLDSRNWINYYDRYNGLTDSIELKAEEGKIIFTDKDSVFEFKGDAKALEFTIWKRQVTFLLKY